MLVLHSPSLTVYDHKSRVVTLLTRMLCYLLLGKLSASVVAAILYPCINGGLAVFTTLLSFFFFREKPTALKIISILLGAAAIVVLNLG